MTIDLTHALAVIESSLVSEQTGVAIGLAIGAVSASVIVTSWVSKKISDLRESILILQIETRVLQESLKEIRAQMWTVQDQARREWLWVHENKDLIMPDQRELKAKGNE